jgi:hypothetical protein
MSDTVLDTATDDLLVHELAEAPVAPAVELRIDLYGSDMAVFGDEVLIHRTPVFEWCRRLVDRGVDPATPLTAYRDGKRALLVRSIGEAAKLAVIETNFGPRIRLFKAGAENADPGAIGPPGVTGQLSPCHRTRKHPWTPHCSLRPAPRTSLLFSPAAIGCATRAANGWSKG